MYYYRIAYNENSYVHNIITRKELIVGGYTTWYEMGHMHQQSEWIWNVIEEIDANIYAWVTKKKTGTPDDYDPEYYRIIYEYFSLP